MYVCLYVCVFECVCSYVCIFVGVWVCVCLRDSFVYALQTVYPQVMAPCVSVHLWLRVCLCTCDILVLRARATNSVLRCEFTSFVF